MSTSAPDNLPLSSAPLAAEEGEEKLLSELLSQDPRNPESLRRMGHLHLRTNRPSSAREFLFSAAELAPDHSGGHVLLAEAYIRLKLPEKGKRSLKRALALDAGHFDAWMMLAELAAGSGAAGLAEAQEALLRAARLRPREHRPHMAMAALMLRAGRHEDAIAAYRAAAKADPALGDMLNNMGVCLDALGRKEEAVSVLRAASLLTPEKPSVHDNLGNSLLSVGDSREAEQCHRRALQLGSRSGNSWSNLGNALHRQGRLDEAEGCYRRAIQSNPDNAKFHTNLALTLLLEGKFEEGWREYEWRWRNHPQLPAHLRDKPWTGADLKGGTLLLQAEQGYGDTIQFIRYAPLLRQRCARILLACQPELVRLMATAPGVDAVLSERDAVPACDAAITLMSLPGLMATDAGNVPGGVPYLAPPPGAGLPLPEGKGLKVGLAWAGRPTHGDDWNRSVPARQLAPLLAMPGVTFYSLQRGAVAERLGRPPADRLIEVADRCADFADTAALIAQMDLVISVDTAIVHLAGAMGKPVWVLLPQVPDFRWLMAGDTSPWYPSMRLFRKPPNGGWEPVIDQVSRKLSSLATI